jgi:glycerate-2-kinase
MLCLSGGASALLALPIEGVSLAALAETTRRLVLGGAGIHEINAVRRRLGAALGGRLAAATSASLEVLALSDVIGDDPSTIGSGPASPDPTSRVEAAAIAARFGAPEEVMASIAGAAAETPAAAHPAFARVRFSVLASPASLRSAARAAAVAAGWRVRALATPFAGDVAEVAAALLAEPPHDGELVIAVGEPTVHVTGTGQGGRAQHLALLMARELAGQPACFVACGSDGSDGPTDAAGAAVDGSTLAAARAAGLDVDAAIASFDSHPTLARLGLNIVTGPTGTNLTDLFLFGRGGAPRRSP